MKVIKVDDSGIFAQPNHASPAFPCVRMQVAERRRCTVVRPALAHPFATAHQPRVDEDAVKVVEGGGGKKGQPNDNVISIR